jgi:hypothetical protein
MPSTIEPAIGAGSVFSPLTAAIIAGAWGWLSSVITFFLFAQIGVFFFGGTQIDSNGFAVIATIVSWLTFGVVTFVALWPLAHFLRDEPRWWEPAPVCCVSISGSILLLYVAMFVTDGFSLGMNLPSLWLFVAVIVMSIIMGIPAGLGASRYYRMTHPQMV